MSPVAHAERALIRLCRAYRSGKPPTCRFLPTCSEFGYEAIGRHGAIKGSGLIARRLCRCHPWGGYGVDPVPE